MGLPFFYSVVFHSCDHLQLLPHHVQMQVQSTIVHCEVRVDDLTCLIPRLLPIIQCYMQKTGEAGSQNHANNVINNERGCSTTTNLMMLLKSWEELGTKLLI